uniref:Uncharacterized protein n=1 Tax=Rhizophora mucronata TaxID=61149 RepID=A0A2P2L688_RHIMU
MMPLRSSSFFLHPPGKFSVNVESFCAFIISASPALAPFGSVALVAGYQQERIYGMEASTRNWELRTGALQQNQHHNIYLIDAVDRRLQIYIYFLLNHMKQILTDYNNQRAQHIITTPTNFHQHNIL